MGDSVKQLLKARKKFDSYEYSEKELSKIKGTPSFGCKIKVSFPDKFEGQDFGDIEDHGYIFSLPDCDTDIELFDFFIHIPEMDNPSGKDRGEPHWCHIGEIITNKLVSKISFYNHPSK